jgi:blue light- and temperature-responsive anti-repressor
MSNLIHLIYNSAQTTAFSDDALRHLLTKARNKNASLDITGMLLYVDGSFFQVLEGPEEKIDAVVATIEKDPRHSLMTVIIREPIHRRSFSEWTMGFTRMTSEEVSEIEGLNDFFDNGQSLVNVDAGRAKKLLTAFKQGRWRIKMSTPVPKEVAAHGLGRSRSIGISAERTEMPRPMSTFAFQPIVQSDTGEVIGCEALVRGVDGAAAAEILQRVPLGEIAAFDEDGHRRAIGMAHRLNFMGNLHLNVVPQMHGKSSKALESVLETAALCGIPASRIVLEVKHESTILDPLSLVAWMQDYRLRGMQICIDDFGSGHAGLALLDHYQPEMISLARWIVQGIDGNGPRQAIVRGLMQTCNDLGIDIIAKGVETKKEYKWLVQEGISHLQGFLIASPELERIPAVKIPSSDS